MSADTRSSRRIPAPLALGFAANAATQFAIQAWLAYGFADHVWGLAQPLPWAAPVALDLFAIFLMGAAFMLRQAQLRQRAYVWCLLALVIGSQMAASEGFADHENWNAWGRAASLAPAVFLAGSLHVLIMVARLREHAEPSDAPARVRQVGWWAMRRAMRRDRASGVNPPKGQAVPSLGDHGKRDLGSTPDGAPQREVTTREQRALGAAPVRMRPARPARPTAPPSPAGGRRPNPNRDTVIKRVLDADPGEDAKTVAEELGVNVRTAQLWVSTERDRRRLLAGAGISAHEKPLESAPAPIGDGDPFH